MTKALKFARIKLGNFFDSGTIQVAGHALNAASDCKS
jgi:hypothetical protein